MFKTSELYEINLNATEDIVVNQGGTYSGKTYSIDQVLLTKAIQEPNRVITIVGESIPNLKKGAMRDAETIIASSEVLQSLISSRNKSDRTITFSSGTIVEFTSYVTAQDAHSGKRDYLFINEAPGISWEIAEQLIDRTEIRTYIDYNPSIPFWAHEKLIRPGVYGDKKVKVIISDHRHNPFLTKAQHDHIERKAKEDPEWGRVYARGKTGKIEGLVFKEWKPATEIPQGAKYIGSSLDFGFTNDPTASADVYMSNGELFIKETLYETGLTNPDIFEILDKSNRYIADSAEPKSIEELKRLGLKVEASTKGKDSVKAGIDILKRYKLNLIGVNLKREFMSYKWKEDRQTGLPLNEPVDFMNHLIDGIRYVALNKLKTNKRGSYNMVPISR